MINELIRMCLISSVFSPILVEGREIPLRSQINVVIESPFGTGKTYMLEAIRQKNLGIVMDRWTENAFYGTINRMGQIIPPATIFGAGRTILIDEFQSIPIKFKQPLLKLLEEQTVNRELLNIAGNVPIFDEEEKRVELKPTIKIERPFYSMYAIKNYLVFTIRASYLIFTSKLYDHSEMDKMLLSRCIVLRLEFTVDDLYNPIKLQLDDIEELREQLMQYQGKYTAEQDKYYLDLVVQELTEAKLPFNYAYRIRDHLIRIDNCIRALESVGEKVKLTAEDFLPLIIAGYKGIRFRPVELMTYAKLPNISEAEFEYAESLEKKGVVKSKESKYVRCCNFGGGKNVF